ncbi:MAG: pseudouridine synthase [Pseudomonadota bacterium]
MNSPITSTLPAIPAIDDRDILHLDDNLIALNKPAGLLSVPGRTEPDCLETRVQRRFPDALTVHRLDMATSGVMLMARGKKALASLQQQFERRQTQKTYIAIVRGQPKKEAGTVDAPMRCDWPNRPRQIICYERGRQALTHWHVLERMQSSTRMMLTPITGRSHQLRVHMSVIGHPIVGDPWYGAAHEDKRHRLHLHAERLCVTPPNANSPVTFIAPCPF